MTGPNVLNVYVFRDPHFAPDGDTMVCVAERSQTERFFPKKEIAWAFSGHAVYRRWPWKAYVGVWGKKNASRFRRFLRERGAELVIHHDEPTNLRLCYFTTDKVRRRVRSLPANVP